jgi:membrane protein
VEGEERGPRPAARGIKGVLLLVRDAGKDWSKDKAPRLGAALSYYTVFAIAPVLLLAISVAGLVLGNDAAQGHILQQLRGLFGEETARMIQEALARSGQRKSGIIGTAVGVGTLIVGATAVMIELEAALNAVWKVVAKEGHGFKGILGVIKGRLLSLGLVLSLGFLLLVSLVTSAMLAALGGQLERFSFPGAAIVGQLLNNALSLGLIAVFFALIFKYLPDVKITWRDVWVGALVTSLLFHVGKIGLGVYLGRSAVGSTFGAAGSLALLLVWVYYSAQIVLYGAEITRLYAERYGSGLRPTPDAEPAPNAAQCATNTA